MADMKANERAVLLKQKKDLLEQVKSLNAEADSDNKKRRKYTKNDKHVTINNESIGSLSNAYKVTEKNTRGKADGIHRKIAGINKKLGIKPTLK